MDDGGWTESGAGRPDLDNTFLRWLEARLASGGPDASEDALNYLVASALHAVGSQDRD